MRWKALQQIRGSGTMPSPPCALVLAAGVDKLRSWAKVLVSPPARIYKGDRS
jgi:hypothetical protein